MSVLFNALDTVDDIKYRVSEASYGVDAIRRGSQGGFYAMGIAPNPPVKIAGIQGAIDLTTNLAYILLLLTGSYALYQSVK